MCLDENRVMVETVYGAHLVSEVAPPEKSRDAI